MNCDFFLKAPSPFVLLDAARAMTGADAPHLVAWRRCTAAPFWQVLEAAAQAAALQQRVARDFACHAFLLSVERAPWPAGPLSGTACLEVRVMAQGSGVAASLVRVRGLAGPEGSLPPLELELRVGLLPYDASFSRELLERRYRELYRCLSRNAGAFLTV